MIPLELVTDGFIATWKSQILYDYHNNNCYLPNYTDNEGSYFKLKINNDEI